MSNFEWNDLDTRAVKMAKVLAADAVEKVGNGHPGTAISIAPVAYTLYQKFMNADPSDTTWRGRDRFVLSIGHSSLTQYIQLYLSGAGLELEDLKQFRTFGSLTPGHPEYTHTKGVEITTGPLGQGLASAVGFAYAARYEKGLFDPEGETNLFDHNVYVICGDGDLQEGLTAEAGALAGLQKLGNLVVIWDDNHITIEGDTKIAFTEDVLKRYEAYGWDTQHVDWTNGGSEYKEDVHALADAIEKAKSVTDKPSIIKLTTLIAYPTPGKTGDHGAHGAKLGAEAVSGLKEVLGFDPSVDFPVDDEALAHARQAITRGAALHQSWSEELKRWKVKNPDRAKLYERLYESGTPAKPNQPKEFLGALPSGLDDAIENVISTFAVGEKVATRASSGAVINAIASIMPELWGGSADLAGSNNTTIKGAPSFAPEQNSTEDWTTSPYGRVLHFGIREHAMGQIVNGIVLSSNTRAFGGTFFQFADYMRDSARIAALQGIPSVFVWTHDSIAVGEDGPTHQPVEHISAMRAIPNFNVARPADAIEVAYCWKKALETQNAPTGLILTRQGVPTIDRNQPGYFPATGAQKGGYVLACGFPPAELDVIIIASGSEVQLALEARERLIQEGKKVRVVSMPSMEWFEAEPQDYKDSVLTPSVKARVSVEVGIAQPWYKYLGSAGVPVSLEHFGASGDEKTLYTEFGVTTDAVVAAAKESIAKAN
ncbi:MAG: transketolase [Candidatus Ancillula sp.]|jgi:transketolase|nr:transketolase [Candidatus Ancillula sp.]